MNDLSLGLITGIIFGFLLQKGRVLRFDTQINAMLFKDMTILKFMLSAIMVGMIGFYIMKDIGFIELKHKSMNLGALLVGGSLFGIGWAIMGFCPGTSLGAVGEGRLHAVWAIIGMLIGGGVYAELYPLMKKSVLIWADWGKISLVDVTGWNEWVIICALLIVFSSLFVLFEKKKI